MSAVFIFFCIFVSERQEKFLKCQIEISSPPLRNCTKFTISAPNWFRSQFYTGTKLGISNLYRELTQQCHYSLHHRGYVFFSVCLIASRIMPLFTTELSGRMWCGSEKNPQNLCADPDQWVDRGIPPPPPPTHTHTHLIGQFSYSYSSPDAIDFFTVNFKYVIQFKIQLLWSKAQKCYVQPLGVPLETSGWAWSSVELWEL